MFSNVVFIFVFELFTNLYTIPACFLRSLNLLYIFEVWFIF